MTLSALSPRSYRAILAVIVVVGVARIVATYRVFSETIDEPVHVAAGMEWLDRGTYAEDASHPPLARVLGAAWPYLSGLRSVKTTNFVVDGNYVLYANDNYRTNLSHARAGILPFFVAAVLIVAAWARRLWGDIGGLAAAFVISNEPNILAHSGLDTTDMAAATMTVAAAYGFWRWLEARPRASGLGPGTFVLGITIGLAVLAKFSTLLFVPIACAVVLVLAWPKIERPWRPYFIGAGVAAIITCVVVATGYRFTQIRELWNGIEMVRDHARTGHEAFLHGEFRQFGWWYYFPLCISLKTTLAGLALLFMGMRVVRDRERAIPLAAALAILISALPVTINLGVRHILPVYPFFAIVAGGAVATYRRAGLALCAIAFAASIAAHPDYLPYFNALAGPRPDFIFIDSNLDWGQDLLRLGKEVKRRNVQSMALAYAGNAEPSHHGFPPTTKVDPFHYTPGWVAISETFVHWHPPAYHWLDQFNPVTHAGKSIRLYYLPSFAQLSGADPMSKIDSDRTTLLLPIWFQGTFRGVKVWSCDLTVENDSDRPIDIIAPVRTRVPPRSTLTNPNLGFTDAREGGILYVKRDDAERLHFGLLVRSGTGQTVALPVVRERGLLSLDSRFPSVPISDAAPATLRIYDVTGEASNAIVRLLDDKGESTATIQMRRHDSGAAYPSSTSIALNRLFPGRNLRSARIIVDAPSPAYWACVTVSDPATNQAYVIPPD